MKPSYRLVDYTVRPAKFAERKMLCEFFSRLRPFSPVQQYRYVGLGSIWFADHLLFHKSLGIEEMISIERVSAHKKRFEFNRPFRNIEIRLGAVADHLPGLDWDRPTIMWLDYDDPLSPGILDDVRTVATRARSGLVLAVSVQAKQIYRPPEEGEGKEDIPIRTVGAFRGRFGEKRTPPNLDARSLKGWGVSRTIRQVLRSELVEAVLARSLGGAKESEMEFRQIGAFEYADGAEMTTVVGVFVEPSEDEKFAACGFHELEYYRSGVPAVRIEVPMLTPKETRYLDSLLPGKVPRRRLGAMPPSDAEYYGQLYRYLPNYASFEP